MDFDLSNLWDTLVDYLYDLFYSLVTKSIELAVDLLFMLPLPDFVANIPQYVGNIPPNVLYFAEPLQLPFGLSLIMTAVTARMLLGLIPFIGSMFR